MMLAGLDALTLTPDLLEGLNKEDSESRIANLSMYQVGSSVRETTLKQSNYINDEAKFRQDFAAQAGGKGKSKTEEVMTYHILGTKRLIVVRPSRYFVIFKTKERL
jgi:hypothetical protein